MSEARDRTAPRRGGASVRGSASRRGRRRVAASPRSVTARAEAYGPARAGGLTTGPREGRRSRLRQQPTRQQRARISHAERTSAHLPSFLLEIQVRVEHTCPQLLSTFGRNHLPKNPALSLVAS